MSNGTAADVRPAVILTGDDDCAEAVKRAHAMRYTDVRIVTPTNMEDLTRAWRSVGLGRGVVLTFGAIGSALRTAVDRMQEESFMPEYAI